MHLLLARQDQRIRAAVLVVDEAAVPVDVVEAEDVDEAGEEESVEEVGEETAK